MIGHLGDDLTSRYGWCACGGTPRVPLRVGVPVVTCPACDIGMAVDISCVNEGEHERR